MGITLTRRQMEEKFSQVFPPEQSATLAEVVDEIRQAELERAADTRELKQGLTALTEEVRKLTEAQQRTDERLARFEERTDERFAALAEAQQRTDGRLTRVEEALAALAEAQQRTDESVRELAEAQQRTDGRLIRVEEALAALAEAQQRTDESVRELAEAQRRTDESVRELRVAVGSLANRFGFDLEEFVAALLPPYLERHYDVAGLTLERRYFDLGEGRLEEVDLVGEGERAGRPVLVLAECRTTIGGGELRRIAGRLREIESHLEAREVLRVVVAMNVHPTAEEAGTEEGVLVVPYSRINRER